MIEYEQYIKERIKMKPKKQIRYSMLFKSNRTAEDKLKRINGCV